MANEVTNAALVSTGGRTAEVLSSLLHPAAYDSFDLRSVVNYVPWMANSGSSTMAITKLPAPGPAAAATSELIGGASNAVYTTGEYTLTVARYLRRLEMSDLAAITAPAGGVDMSVLLQSLIEAEALTFTDLICALFPSFSNAVGTSGAVFSVDDFYEAVLDLEEANASGPFACVVSPSTFGEFRQGLRVEGGAIQWRPDTQNALNIGAFGARGSFAGVNFFTSDSCVDANGTTDVVGAMFGTGAISWTAASIDAVAGLAGSDELMRGDTWLIEKDRSAPNGLTGAILNMYPGVAIATNALGTKIVTKK